MLGHLDVEYGTVQRVFNEQWKGWHSVRTFDGNSNACNVWWNDSKRKANLNWQNNYGNGNDWFLFATLLISLLTMR
jgi:hypothetical protein